MEHLEGCPAALATLHVTALPGSDPIVFAGWDPAAEHICVYGGPGRADALGSDPGALGSDPRWHRDRILVVPTDGRIGIGIGSWKRHGNWTSSYS